MNAFFWSRRKPSKELVLKVDALLAKLFPEENFDGAFAPKISAGSGARDSGDAAVAPVVPVVVHELERKPSRRARIESADAADNGDGDADVNGNSASPDEGETSEHSGDDEPPEPVEKSEKSIPEELELLWAKIRSIFQAWDEEQVERERKMNRMAELLLRYRVLEKTLMPKVLSGMTFETRKYVGHVFRAMTVHGFQGFIEYVADRPDIIKWLVDGYKNHHTALICGSMLRDCLEHQPLVLLLLNEMPVEFETLFKVTKTNSNFDISADAFRNITKVLRAHKTVTVACLAESFDRIFGLLNSLLDSTNYVTKRQALQLLGELLLDPVNFSVMQRYVASRNNLKLVMMLLREPSQALRMEAYNVFKIFVANPNKSAEVEQLLVRNREKLLAFVVDFGKTETSREFHQEKSLVVYSLQRITERERTPSSQPPKPTALAPGSGSSTSPASPALPMRKSPSEVCLQHE